MLTLASGPAGAVVRQARLKRDTVHLSLLHMPRRSGRCEPSSLHGALDNEADPLASRFAWMVAPWDDNQGDTSDPQ